MRLRTPFLLLLALCQTLRAAQTLKLQVLAGGRPLAGVNVTLLALDTHRTDSQGVVQFGPSPQLRIGMRLEVLVPAPWVIESNYQSVIYVPEHAEDVVRIIVMHKGEVALTHSEAQITGILSEQTASNLLPSGRDLDRSDNLNRLIDRRAAALGVSSADLRKGIEEWVNRPQGTAYARSLAALHRGQDEDAISSATLALSEEQEVQKQSDRRKVAAYMVIARAKGSLDDVGGELRALRAITRIQPDHVLALASVASICFNKPIYEYTGSVFEKTDCAEPPGIDLQRALDALQRNKITDPLAQIRAVVILWAVYAWGS